MKWTQDRLQKAKDLLDRGMSLNMAAKEMGVHRKSLTLALWRHKIILKGGDQK